MGFFFPGKVKRLRTKVSEISPQELSELLASGAKPILVDVRQPVEFEQGVIEGALLIPLGELEKRAGEIAPNKEAHIVAYCAAGVRSLYAADILAKAGYLKVDSLHGGIELWAGEGRSIVTGP